MRSGLDEHSLSCMSMIPGSTDKHQMNLHHKDVNLVKQSRV
jgi:hypothetical protein